MRRKLLTMRRPKLADAALLAVAILCAALLFGSSSHAAPCANAIACENALTGTPQSQWDLTNPNAGDASIQGFATDISVNKGDTVTFKVNTNAVNYRIDIYRLGYYQGNGARFIAQVLPSASLPQVQPSCLTDSTGLVDCGNWAVSASWQVPSTAVSGVYLAKLTRLDTLGASHMVFIVRDDSSHSDVLFQTSDETWQAYNRYGGNSLYTGTHTAVGNPTSRAYKVSYSRPFTTRAYEPGSWLFGPEYSMIRSLEKNGYDMSYTTGMDSDRRGSLITQHKVFLSVGHDEYWSGGQRSNVEAARNAGVNLAFFSGNEMFWKTRWENAIDGSGSAYRTLVCYKESTAGAKIDPSPVWTGNWRDASLSPPADGGRPENALTGQLYETSFREDAITVPASDAKLRFWRNTSIANLTGNQTASLPTGVLGYEWDIDGDNAFRPPGEFDMSSSTFNVNSVFDNGQNAGTLTHSLSLYRAASGALVFGAGTIQWPYALDTTHDPTTTATVPTDVRMQQATVNLLADMGAQATSLDPALTAASASTDTTAPISAVNSPAAGATLTGGTPVTATGTASDTGGGVVGGVEVSVDSGHTWHEASGTTSWRYTFTPPVTGSYTVLSRAVDDSGNLEQPPNLPCPCSIWRSAVAPATASVGDVNPAEVGVRFRSDQVGSVTGVRFYKGTANTGTHVGHLWTSTGTLLATVTFTGETASGWQQASFDVPVQINANTTYVVSYFAPNGGYALDRPYFNGTGVDDAPLHALKDGVDGANGVYLQGSSGFPTSAFNSSNYWVDIVFSSGPPDTSPPTAPANLVATGSLGQVSLSWSASTDNVGVRRYDIYRSTTSGFTAAPANRVAQTTGTTYADSGLTPGTYYYLVQAEDAAGNLSPSSNEANGTALADTSPPTAPTSLVATGGAGTASLSWNASSDNVAVSRYDVYRSTTSGFTPSVSNRVAQPTGTSYVESGLTANTYYYLVQAEDPTGNLSPSSNQATAIVTPPPTGLVAAYSFNEGTGTTVLDASGNGNTGTLTSTTWTNTGKYGNALSFNGSTSWVTVPDSASLHLTNKMTLEAWVNPNLLNGAWRTVMIKQQTGAGVAYSLYEDTDQHVPVTQAYTTGENDAYGTALLALNIWTHLTATYDGSTLKLYVNGSLVASAPVTGNLISSTGALRIGGNSVWGEFFSGLIDEVRIYNRALTPTEIQSDMQTPVGTGAPADSSPPTAPGNLVATAGPSSAGLTWTASTDNVGVTRYDVYRSTTSGFTPAPANRIAQPTGTSYTDSPLTPATYYYRVQAEDAAGNLSAASNEASAVVTGDITPPSAPANLTATAGAGTASLSWGASTDNVGVTRYDVYRSTTSGFTPAPANRIAQPTGTSYTDSALTPATYYYRVQAEDAAGNLSAASNEASAVVTDTTPPSAPANLTATAGQSSAGLTWTASTDNVGVTRYDVYRSTTSGFTPAPANRIAQPTGTSYTDSPLTPATYYYRVQAEDAAGNLSTASNEASAVVTDTTPPSMPANLTATGGAGTASLSWGASTDNVGVTRYDVYRSTTSGFTPAPANRIAQPTGTSYTDSALAAGTYYYLVQAEDAAGNLSAASNEASAVVTGDITPPSAPANLTATGGAGSASLTWTASTDNVGVTRYDVYRSTTSGFTPAPANRIAQPTGTSYTDSALAAGTYYYLVQAEDAAGNLSAASNEASATITGDITPPTAPSNLATTAGLSSATLTWTASTDNVGVTRYDVYRSTTSGFTPAPANRIAQPTGTSYTDSALAAGTYYYLVQAEDAAGNLSAASNEASATITDTTPPSAPANLTATVAAGSASLTWTASTDNVGVTRYDVYRSTTSGFTPAPANRIAQPTGTSYTDPALAAGTYYYRVQAEDAAGNLSAASNQATAVVADTTAPTAPANLTATGGAGTASLTWTASTDNVGVTRYDVYRSTTSGFIPAPANRIAQPTGTSYTDSALAAGTYYYLVQAEDAAGNLSAASNQATGVVTAVPTGLVAAYSFNEGTGTTVSGTGTTGTLTSTTWTTSGKYGNALSFNGTSSWVTIADSASLHLTNKMTLEAWVNPNLLTGGWRTIIIKQQTGKGVAYSLYGDTDQHTPATQVYIGGEANVYGTAVLPLNVWTHLASTYDGSTLKLYVNGTLVLSTPVTGNIISSTGALRIGGNNIWGEFFSGLIDEVRIYNRPLAQAEIQTDMQTAIH